MSSPAGTADDFTRVHKALVPVTGHTVALPDDPQLLAVHRVLKMTVTLMKVINIETDF